jgi:uncharacterized repeat protein (TIGR03837 family)
MFPARTWDIFCTVVDNYGDIGVCWRLARQLAAEQGQQVRLWVDDLASFHRLCPELDPTQSQQSCHGVDVRHWCSPFPDISPADVVVEAFGCELPANYLAAMASRQPKPAWVNLEYLSAESWVQGCHGMASPHPRLPLTKYFFFPGFVPGTGGLPVEGNLMQQRDALQQDGAAQVEFWRTLGLQPPLSNELRISLFCYGGQHVAGLFDAWATGAMPVTCLVAEGPVLQAVAAYFGLPGLKPGNKAQRGNLDIHVLPFLEQDRYDRLLWACDCNFVRGEDSFVRAQWAARPMVWQAYPQQAGTHLVKLQAFLDIYGAGLPQQEANALHNCWLAWNQNRLEAVQWWNFWQHRPALQAHAARWADGLLRHPAHGGNLALNLVQFVQDKL